MCGWGVGAARCVTRGAQVYVRRKVFGEQHWARLAAAEGARTARLVRAPRRSTATGARTTRTI